MLENWQGSCLVLRELREFRSFHTNAKVFQPTKKSIFVEIRFQIVLYYV